MRGALLYQNQNCNSCHGDEPENGVRGIYKGVTADVLEAAYRRVREMNVYASSLSAANNDDLAAFIKSRVDPD